MTIIHVCLNSHVTSYDIRSEEVYKRNEAVAKANWRCPERGCGASLVSSKFIPREDQS